MSALDRLAIINKTKHCLDVADADSPGWDTIEKMVEKRGYPYSATQMIMDLERAIAETYGNDRDYVEPSLVVVSDKDNDLLLVSPFIRPIVFLEALFECDPLHSNMFDILINEDNLKRTPKPIPRWFYVKYNGITDMEDSIDYVAEE